MINWFDKYNTIAFGKLKRDSETEFEYKIFRGPYNRNVAPIIIGMIKANPRKYTYEHGYAVIIYRYGKISTWLTPEEFKDSEIPEED